MSRNPALPSPGQRSIPWAPIVYGVIFVAALAVLGTTLANRISDRGDVLTLSVVTEAGAPVEDAIVSYGEKTYQTNADGEVILDVLEDRQTIMVQREGYMTVSGDFDAGYARTQELTLKEVPSNVAPTTPEPGAGSQPDAASTPATPAGTPTVRASAPERPGEVAGTVRNIDGQPIERGWVTDGKTYAFTDADGNFVFEPGAIVANAHPDGVCSWLLRARPEGPGRWRRPRCDAGDPANPRALLQP